jgi:hypothetical protein
MSAIVIEREGKAPIVINPPADPALARLWLLAHAKTGGHGVVTEYEALLRKPHGSLTSVIREICEKVPGGD